MTQRHDSELLNTAVNWRRVIWNSDYQTEDERLETLRTVCIQLCDGDAAKGEKLASDAIWTPGSTRPLTLPMMMGQE